MHWHYMIFDISKLNYIHKRHHGHYLPVISWALSILGSYIIRSMCSKYTVSFIKVVELWSQMVQSSMTFTLCLIQYHHSYLDDS